LFRHIKKVARLEHVREELNDRALFYILKRYIQAAELTSKKLPPHSFRATFATLLSSNGVDGLEIQKGGRWRDYDTMSGYVREGKEFKSEWSKRLGF
jgi:site-specific recombinase XerD